MANTINDLYLKYVNKVGRTLENDRYFQYLFEMVQAGNNAIQQNNRILHKVVDERWLGTIEESLDAINNIIEKPRRYIKTNEEVVPVALARKITADSVRHLSMNTQFIASSEDGDIQPTRVLNVTTEETYDLYENRFIYHLIQRLVTFIDKRTDVIFWSTGDEITNTLKYESKVDDAYEEIAYKVEMTIKNRQSFAENDTDNMSVFMRIDRVRRLVMAMRNSSFCDIMAGCAKVRSPIQRTNLIMKDPNYKICYKLWQFLESYDEVGYTIEQQDTAMEFDEDYLFQMYTNLITNYTVFKSLMETDNRKIDAPENKKRKRVIKPKFIKKIEEEIVDDYNIPDVEVRQVFIEEVTQAQLDAEAKLVQEIENRKKAEEELDRMDGEMISLQQQVSNLFDQVQDAEVRAEKDRQAAEEAKKKAEEEAVKASEALTRAEETAKEKENLALELSQVRESAENMVEAARANAEARISDTIKDAEAKIAEIQQIAEDRTAEAVRLSEERAADAEKKAEALVEQTTKDAEEKVEKTKQEAEAQMAKLQSESDARTAKIQSEAKANLEKTKREASAEIEKTKREADEKLKETKRSADAALSETVERINRENAEKAAREKKELEDRLMREIEILRQQNQALEHRSAEEQKKRDEAEKRLAEARDNAIKLDTRARNAEAAAARAKEQAENADSEKQAALQQVKTALSQAEAMEKKAEEAEKRAKTEAAARAKAEAKAESDSLTKALARRLNRKYIKKNEDDDQLKH